MKRKSVATNIYLSAHYRVDFAGAEFALFFVAVKRINSQSGYGARHTAHLVLQALAPSLLHFGVPRNPIGIIALISDILFQRMDSIESLHRQNSFSPV